MSGVAAAFRGAFGRAPEGVWSAPGRLNLIGEHTDYNDGFALPFAIGRTLSVAAARRDDDRLRLRSAQEDETCDTAVGRLHPGSPAGWAGYPAGAVWALGEHGHRIGGMDVLVDSAIPPGAGLSSSAALTCATTVAAAELHGVAPDPMTVARLAQHAENAFVGMPCGLMDQMTVLRGRRGHALLIDTRGPRCDPVPFDPAAHGLALLAIDTRAPHRLVGTAYAERRRSCERAAELLGVPALRDVTPDGLAGALAELPGALHGRVRHVVTENARVLRAAELLRAGRPAEIGPLLTASHASLRDDYEVSVPETDTAAEAAERAGALGARITGGGFGGCVIALVPADRTEGCAASVRAAFAARGFTPPQAFTATPADGARRVAGS